MDQLLPAIALALTLIKAGWEPDYAYRYTAAVPAYYRAGTSYGGAFYQTKPYYIVYGSANPRWQLVEHEYIHAATWIIVDGDPSKQLREDFTRLSKDSYDLRTANFAGLIVRERAGDEVHWPHYLLDYLQRKKYHMPAWFRDKWYKWLKGHRQIIPLSWR